MKLAGVLLIVSIAVCVVSCEKPTKIWGEVEGYELIGTGEANTGYSPNQITMRAVKLPKKVNINLLRNQYFRVSN